MYSTSPSSSSMASSSGRSSPEHQQQSSGSKQQRSNSFLLPQFFFPQGNTAASNQDNSSHPVQNALLSQHPRRTSFGTGFSNSGRFSALSAFGFTSASTGLSSSPPASFAGASELSRRSGSAVESPQSESLSSSPANESTQKSGSFSTTTTMAAPAPPAKRHLCFPDGMGGTMCVEVKDPKRRGSSVN